MSKKIKIAINGFGRIGRAAFKVALDNPEVEIVGINDLADLQAIAHLLKYDSVYGVYPKEIKIKGQALVIDGKTYPVSQEKEPEKLPWRKLGVLVVLECTGIFTTSVDAKKHLAAGAEKVIISAPAKDETPIYLLGINERDYQGEKVISMGSCTTNCIAPVMKVMSEKFGVLKSLLTTVHSYTADQNLIDNQHRDLRRARAAGVNIVPTTTGAAITVAKVITELKGNFDGLSVRVPTPIVSLSDIVLVTQKKVTLESVNQALKTASQSKELLGILTVTDEPLVSTDFIGNPASAIVDLSLTKVIGGDLVKIIAWYDNEWGYANRLVEMAKIIN